MSTIDTRFSNDHPICASEGRYGDIYITQGGVRPSRWTGDPEKPCTDAGIDAPLNAPEMTLDSDPSFYVARTDVQKPGAVYYAPPEITYGFEPRKVAGPPDEDGNPTVIEVPVNENFREAKAKAYLEQAALNEIEQIEEGKYYPTPPTIALSETHGKNAELEAILECEPNFIEDEGNSTVSGITFYALKGNGPPWQDEQGTALPNEAEPTQYPIFPFAILDIESNGVFDFTCPYREFNLEVAGIKSFKLIWCAGWIDKCRLIGGYDFTIYCCGLVVLDPINFRICCLFWRTFVAERMRLIGCHV